MTPFEDECDDLNALRPRVWSGGWRRWIFPGLWLIYLAQAVDGVHKHASGVGAVLGYVLIAIFAFCYLAAIPTAWSGDRRRFFVLYAACFVLTAIELALAHQAAFVFFVYISVLTVSALRRLAPLIVAAMALIALFGPKLWHAQSDAGDAVAVVLVAFAMYGFFSVIQSNVALAAARSEVARLAAENERSRIARDLHDLLGHSLTTITVKAGLARRLAERGELERAMQEVTEVEALSRRTLGEVRAAVSGYRDVTLSGELATAREVLRAAGIDATLPGAVDIVDDDALEPFGWVVREAITNVVRHSRAMHCTITLGPRWIEIVDDGRGGAPGAGNGLAGLRERLADVHGTVEAGGSLRGWRVRAELASASVSTDQSEHAPSVG